MALFHSHVMRRIIMSARSLFVDPLFSCLSLSSGRVSVCHGVVHEWEPVMEYDAYFLIGESRFMSACWPTLDKSHCHGETMFVPLM